MRIIKTSFNAKYYKSIIKKTILESTVAFAEVLKDHNLLLLKEELESDLVPKIKNNEWDKATNLLTEMFKTTHLLNISEIDAHM